MPVGDDTEDDYYRNPESGAKWTLVGLGCLILGGLTFLSAMGLSIPAFLLYMFLNVFGCLALPGLFLIYNAWILNDDDVDLEFPPILMSGILATTLAGFCVWANYKLWMSGDYAYSLCFNGLFALFTFGGLAVTVKVRKSDALIWSNILMFAWFITVAFPWRGGELP